MKALGPLTRENNSHAHTVLRFLGFPDLRENVPSLVFANEQKELHELVTKGEPGSHAGKSPGLLAQPSLP